MHTGLSVPLRDVKCHYRLNISYRELLFLYVIAFCRYSSIIDTKNVHKQLMAHRL